MEKQRYHIIVGLKKASHRLLYRLAAGILVFFRIIFRVLPDHLFRTITGSVIKFLVSVFLSRHRICRNLDKALGETHSAAAKKGLAKGVQLNIARMILDCVFQWLDPMFAHKHVTVTGIENLESALAKGKGVIALGAHIGNYPLVGARLGLKGYPVHTLFRVPTDEKVKDFFDKLQSPFHQNIIPSHPRRMAVTRVLSALKKNEIVFILADNLKKGKISTSLLGQAVLSPRGPVSLALRSGAVVLQVYLIRNYEGSLDLVIGEEIPMTRQGNLLADIVRNTNSTMVYLEDLIRCYPDQWNWLTVRMRGRRQTDSRPEVASYLPIDGSQS